MIGGIIGLKLEPAAVFMVGVVLALHINYPDLEMQRQRIDAHARAALLMAGVPLLGHDRRAARNAAASAARVVVESSCFEAWHRLPPGVELSRLAATYSEEYEHPEAYLPA